MDPPKWDVKKMTEMEKVFARGRVYGMYECGKSYREIEELTGMPFATASQCVKRIRESGSCDRKQGSGRPPILTAREKRYIERMIENDRFVSICKIQEDLGLYRVSHDTINRFINKDLGFQSRYSVAKPFVNETNADKRLEFARMYVDKPPEFWHRYGFSDESIFDLINRFRERVWVRSGERFDTKCTHATVKHSKGVMVWGGFCASGVTKLVRIEGTVNAEAYINIMNTAMLPSFRLLFGRRRWIFQQDNAPAHKAEIVTQWFEDRGVTILDWPPQSPDLNPIENLWAILDYRLRERRPRNEEELFQQLENAWNLLEPELLVSLVESMPNRLKECIDREGYQTSY